MITQKLVEDFHRAFNLPINRKLTEDEYLLRLRLIAEEWAEFSSEAGMFDTSRPSDGFLKEMCDLIYVLVGTAVACGMDVDKAFARVHMSNMSKLGSDGKPVYRSDGKVLKGEGYVPPNLTDCVPQHEDKNL
jgi:hypothetical protein